ncbi:BglG family transcription antiterminator [Polycladomyces sp. WAk]|uniref:BglG family transcription antiterminator n=1 Tax=Polycladomyces zharkentensis TaxID=2807616 RepID=A0ABS2WK92_9BACL|nr:BglG family transcription antiterminator [Polycladomyces sp. WAk]MBN2909977.1 BglG family transcription antiterminator [Polycladomyces sp. WAk]
MENRPIIYSRQKRLLQILLIHSSPVSVQQLAEMLKVSLRTVQRELQSLKEILSCYGLKIVRKTGHGVTIEGHEKDKQRLLEDVQQMEAFRVYSPEERQEGIIFDLLLTDEPVKLYTFSRKYHVTEATISLDLDKVEPWFEQAGMKLIRKPGWGVCLEGTQQQKRMALSKFLHQGTTFEEWLALFQTSVYGDQYSEHPLGVLIRDRLLKFINIQHILAVEKAAREVVGRHHHLELTDRNYVNLVIHLLLAVERMKHGAVSEEQTPLAIPPEAADMVPLAREIVSRLESALSVSVPEVEIGYIALHLSGAAFKQEDLMEHPENMKWIDLTQSFIRTVGQELGVPLQGDAILFEGLLAHLIPAVSRLENGLQIHNPMLEEIKGRYPDVFHACRKSVALLSDHFPYEVPQDEIGYLALHVGAALIRKREGRRFRTVVVCASGFGTSTYLTARLENEVPHLEIKGIISVGELKKWLKENGPVDLIVSTIPIPFVDDERLVIVHPFLQKEDLIAIERKMSLLRLDDHPFQEPKEASPSALSLAKSGEGVMQILHNLRVIDGINVSGSVLKSLYQLFSKWSAIRDPDTLYRDIEKREKQGGFVLDDLAMIHAKTEGVNELLMAVFRLQAPVAWQNDTGENRWVTTFLLLAAPRTAPKEHIDLISQISGALIEDDFIELLKHDSTAKIRKRLETLLSEALISRTNECLKGVLRP